MHRIYMYMTMVLALLVVSSFVFADETVRIAFGSCAKQDQPQPIWDAVVDCDPDLFLFIGDAVYADSSDPDVIQQAFDQLNQLSGFQKLRNHCPIYGIWDDHDYGINDGGSEHPRKQEVQRVFQDFFGVPKESKQRTQEGVYQAFVMGDPGKRVQVIMLDTRYHRGPLKTVQFGDVSLFLPSNDSSVTMLGDSQWRWLEDQLQMPAEIRLLVSSIQVIPDIHPFEKWANLPHERTKLFNAIAASNGVIILSGDQHFAEVSQLHRDGQNELLEFTSSGLTHTRGNIAAPSNHRVGASVVEQNFGLIDINWTLADPSIVFTARSTTGQVLLKHEIRSSQLRSNAAQVINPPIP